MYNIVHIQGENGTVGESGEPGPGGDKGVMVSLVRLPLSKHPFEHVHVLCDSEL